MKGTYLGEFEEIVLLTVAILSDQAYAVAIKNELSKHTNRKVNISAVHLALYRLEDKKFLTSKMGGATSERGGRRKRFFQLTRQGKLALQRGKDLRNHLWSLIPDFSV